MKCIFLWFLCVNFPVATEREADCSDADYKLVKEEIHKLNDMKIKEVNYVRNDFMLQ